jgi:hypothetical protein
MRHDEHRDRTPCTGELSIPWPAKIFGCCPVIFRVLFFPRGAVAKRCWKEQFRYCPFCLAFFLLKCPPSCNVAGSVRYRITESLRTKFHQGVNKAVGVGPRSGFQVTELVKQIVRMREISTLYNLLAS